MPASAPRTLQEHNRARQTVRVVARHLLHSVRNRGELVGAERRGYEHDSRVLAICGKELPGQLREILDVARDDGATSPRRIQELASIVDLDVAGNLVSSHGVQPPGPEHLGDARREILVEVERHLVVTTRTSPG